jgi:hypothetical protein
VSSISPIRPHPLRHLRRLAVPTALAAASVVAISGCSSSLDSEKLSQEITSQVDALVPEGTQTSVNCPSGIKPEQGATFTCTLTINGQDAVIDVTQSDADGNVTFESQSAILFMDKAQEEITSKVTEQVPGTWTTTCNPPKASGGVYLAEPGSTFDCSVTGVTGDGQEQSGTAVVTVDDNKGNISFEIQ